MKTHDVTRAATPERLAQYLANLPKGMHHHGGPVETVREADHKGHHIVIGTKYQFEVDGRSLDLPMGVDNTATYIAIRCPTINSSRLSPCSSN